MTEMTLVRIGLTIITTICLALFIYADKKLNKEKKGVDMERIIKKKKPRKLRYGVGINDYDGLVYYNGKNIRSYDVWLNMMQRCYDDEFKNRQTTYKDCTVCDEWLSFSNFKKWYDENYPQHLEDKGIKLDLDKDLLIAENKIYSPDTCIFIPHCVNSFIIGNINTNTSGRVGVSFDNDRQKWMAYTTNVLTHKRINIGRFRDKQEAIRALDEEIGRQIEILKSYMRELGYSEDIIRLIEKKG